jgi:hypothetical protein
MTPDEAADVIRAVAASIERNPRQFSFTVNTTIVGTRVEQSGPGVGIQATAYGGGPDSHTVGYKSSVTTGDLADVDIRNAVMPRLDDAGREAVAALNALADHVAAGHGKGKIKAALERVSAAAVMPAMAVDVANLAIGLAQLGS